MSLESLKKELSDLESGIGDSIGSLVGVATIGDVVTHLREHLWPTMEMAVASLQSMHKEVDEIDDAVLELAEEEGDMLTPGTAGVFANAFLMSREMALVFKARIDADKVAGHANPGDPELAARLDGLIALIDKSNEQLGEIIVGEIDDADDDDDDEEDDDDDK